MMVGENGTPETPDWILPDRCDVFETPQMVIPPNIILGTE